MTSTDRRGPTSQLAFHLLTAAALGAARALAVTTADLATMARIKLERGAEVLDAVDALPPGAQVGAAAAQVLGIGGLRERAARVERLFGRP